MSNNAKAENRSRRIIISLLLLTLVAGSAAGYAFWRIMTTSADSTFSTSKQKPIVEPIFFILDTFTINLVSTDNDPDRVLYVGFTLRLPNEETRRRMKTYLPEVRSRLLLLLSRQNATALANEQGKQQLISEIKQVLSPPFAQGQPTQHIDDVLFTAFILR